jgi:purine nucleosidase
MNYVHTGENRPIRVYEAVDQRFIQEDFFAKLAGFAKE